MRYIVLDIETRDADEASLALETSVLKPNGNIKRADSKRKNLEEKAAALREKAALLDSSPVACLALKSETEIFAFCDFPFSPDEQAAFGRAGIGCMAAPNEAQMLISLRSFMNARCDADTEIVTFNGRGFDLPKLRFRYARNGLALPEVLKPRQNRHTDVMLLYSGYFTIKNTPFVSLGEVVAFLGIAKGKVFDGAQVPAMIAEGKYGEVLLYNILDTLLTERVYLMLTSQHGA